MAGKTAILKVDIIADATKLKKGTDEAEGRLGKFQSSMNKLTVPAALIAAGLGKIAGDMGALAASAEQNIGAINAVFGNNAKEVENWSKNASKNLGLSASDYNKQMASIGGALKNAGLPMDQVAGKANELTGAAADLASVFGGETSEAAGAMGAALRGEFDSLERFGIFMNQNKIDAQLAASGQDKLTGAALEGAKKQAILNEIMSQAGPYLGNFAKEAGTATGAQQIATAAWEDAQAKLGSQLLPLLVKGAELLSSFATFATENSGAVTALAVGLGLLVAAILIINAVMAVMNAIALINPFVLLGIAIAVLIGFVIYLATQTTVFQDIWAAVASFCADVWNGFVGFITDVWNGFWGFLKDVLGNIGNFFKSVFSGIGSFVGNILNNIGNFFGNVFRGAQSVVGGVINFITGAFNNVRNAVNGVLSFIGSIFSNVFNGVSNTVSWVINTIVGAFNSVSGAVQSAINWVRSLFNGFSVPGWLRDVMNFMGLGTTGLEVDGSFLPALMGLPEGMGATGFILPAAAFGGGSGSKTEVTNINVTVNGAIDPISTARQIKQLINSDAIRNGSIAAGGSIW